MAPWERRLHTCPVVLVQTERSTEEELAGGSMRRRTGKNHRPMPVSFPEEMGALSKEDAAKYAALALEAAAARGPVVERRKLGPAQDEVLLARCSNGAWLLYVGGSDLDNSQEWLHNAAVFLGRDSFAEIVQELKTLLLSHHVTAAETCVFVGYSRGAAIVLALAEASHKDDFVVTLGDPGLVRPAEDEHVTALRNQFDALFGIIAQPAGTHEQVSTARLTRTGWNFHLTDVGGHLNYPTTLQNEAAASDLVQLALCPHDQEQP
jgi:hypothetical protein